MELFYQNGKYVTTKHTMTCIYLIRVNNKNYVGRATDIKKRILKHICDSSHIDTKLYYCIRKYGWKDVEIYILEETTKDKLNNLEKHYADKHDVYNKDKGLNTIECGGYNPMDNAEVRTKLIKIHNANKKKRAEKYKQVITKLCITLAHYPTLLNRLYDEYYKNEIVAKQKQHRLLIDRLTTILNKLPDIFTHTEYKHIIGARQNIDQMEANDLIYPIKMISKVIIFKKGNKPTGYKREDIVFNKIKKRHKIDIESMRQMNKEYNKLYADTNLQDPTYNWDKHRDLHYERIYGRKHKCFI